MLEENDSDSDDVGLQEWLEECHNEDYYDSDLESMSDDGRASIDSLDEREATRSIIVPEASSIAPLLDTDQPLDNQSHEAKQKSKWKYINPLQLPFGGLISLDERFSESLTSPEIVKMTIEMLQGYTNQCFECDCHDVHLKTFSLSLSKTTVLVLKSFQELGRKLHHLRMFIKSSRSTSNQIVIEEEIKSIFIELLTTIDNELLYYESVKLSLLELFVRCSTWKCMIGLACDFIYSFKSTDDYDAIVRRLFDLVSLSYRLSSPAPTKQTIEATIKELRLERLENSDQSKCSQSFVISVWNRVFPTLVRLIISERRGQKYQPRFLQDIADMIDDHMNDLKLLAKQDEKILDELTSPSFSPDVSIFYLGRRTASTKHSMMPLISNPSIKYQNNDMQKTTSFYYEVVKAKKNSVLSHSYRVISSIKPQSSAWKSVGFSTLNIKTTMFHSSYDTLLRWSISDAISNKILRASARVKDYLVNECRLFVHNRFVFEFFFFHKMDLFDPLRQLIMGSEPHTPVSISRAGILIRDRVLQWYDQFKTENPIIFMTYTSPPHNPMNTITETLLSSLKIDLHFKLPTCEIFTISYVEKVNEIFTFFLRVYSLKWISDELWKSTMDRGRKTVNEFKLVHEMTKGIVPTAFHFLRSIIHVFSFLTMEKYQNIMSNELSIEGGSINQLKLHFNSIVDEISVIIAHFRPGLMKIFTLMFSMFDLYQKCLVRAHDDDDIVRGLEYAVKNLDHELHVWKKTICSDRLRNKIIDAFRCLFIATLGW